MEHVKETNVTGDNVNVAGKTVVSLGSYRREREGKALPENLIITHMVKNLSVFYGNRRFFDVELRLSPRWVRGNIGSTDATKIRHNLNAYIFETNICKVINNTSLDSL
jgi:hypothetical protein